MTRARSYKLVSVFLAVGLAGFVALSACSNYGEGERCETLNGNDDCDDGLVCTPKSQLTAPFNSSDRCCPSDRTLATTTACAVPQNAVGTDAAPPSETGPGVDATVGEAGKDAADAAEAATDAADADEGG